MTTTDKEVQIALGTYLSKVWKESSKLWAEGHKLWAEGHKLWAEGRKLQAEGDKLWVEGGKFCAEGNKIFTDAVIEVYGSDIIEWTDYGCKVAGREFRE